MIVEPDGRRGLGRAVFFQEPGIGLTSSLSLLWIVDAQTMFVLRTTYLGTNAPNRPEVASPGSLAGRG